MIRGAHGIWWVVAGIVLTLVAIVARDLLPPRTWDLLAPGLAGDRFLSEAAAESGGSVIEWTDLGRTGWRCRIAPADTKASCGLTVALAGRDWSHGVDLRGFRSLAIDVSYRGKTEALRLAIRNFDPRFSRSEDGNSSRIHTINLRARDVGVPLSLDLGDLSVPEWWIAQYNLPRAYNLPDLGNATALSIDLPGNLTGQDIEVELRSLALQRDWITREALYLAILLTWLTCASAAVTVQLIRLRRQHLAQAREIQNLMAQSQLVHAERDELARLTTVDPLTGVLNRRGIEAAIADLAGRSDTTALILLDLDHFKRINDQHGHEAGDRVLQLAGAVLAQAVRAGDVVGRWGGEEFLVVSIGCEARHAQKLAEKLRQRVESTSFSARRQIPVTVSVGVALLEPAGDFTEAFRRADAAMYQAKARGRNRVALDPALNPAPALSATG